MEIDNYDLWEMHDAEQEAELDKLPLCEICGQPIQQEQAIYYNDQWFCESCEDEAWAVIRGDFLESITD